MRAAAFAVVVVLGVSLAAFAATAPGTENGIWVGRWENDAVVASSIHRVSPPDGGDLPAADDAPGRHEGGLLGKGARR